MDAGPSQKFSKVNLQSLGAALRQADKTLVDNPPPVKKPRLPFSSKSFNSETITDDVGECTLQESSSPKNLFPDSSEIMTIDWDCLKSVTMTDNMIDIHIPDTAVKMVKVLKTKKKKATSKTQSLTIDNSEIISGKQKSKSKNRKTKRNLRNIGSDVNNARVSAEPIPVQKVSDSTLNSL